MRFTMERCANAEDEGQGAAAAAAHKKRAKRRWLEAVAKEERVAQMR